MITCKNPFSTNLISNSKNRLYKLNLPLNYNRYLFSCDKYTLFSLKLNKYPTNSQFTCFHTSINKFQLNKVLNNTSKSSELMEKNKAPTEKEFDGKTIFRFYIINHFVILNLNSY
jgi:hypothetical protein